MKAATLTAMLVLSFVLANAQYKVDSSVYNVSIDRYLAVSTDTFIIHYVYDSNHPFVVGTTRLPIDSESYERLIMGLHYRAIIQVYFMRNGAAAKVGKSFVGVFVPATCTEDDPVEEIKYALGRVKGNP